MLDETTETGLSERERADKGEKVAGRVARALLAGLGASFASVSIFGKLAEGALEHPIGEFDKTASGLAHEPSPQRLERAALVLSEAGEPRTLYLVAGIVSAAWLAGGRKADVGAVALAIEGSALINNSVKLVVKRPRPRLRLHHRGAGSSGSSFPSNHAMMSLALYGTLAHLVARRRRKRSGRSARGVWIAALALCALTGWSRVYLGMHRPSDVLGGWLAGSIWLAACSAARGSPEPVEAERG
jgi:membrane-associated phospholipid phosphatase